MIVLSKLFFNCYNFRATTLFIQLFFGEGIDNYNLIIRSIRWRNENEEASPPSLKRRLFLRPSAVKVPKRKCAGGEPNLSEDQLSKWKQQLVENAETSLFASTDKQSSEAAERIAHLEQLVGRLTVALDIQKKASAWLS